MDFPEEEKKLKIVCKEEKISFEEYQDKVSQLVSSITNKISNDIRLDFI
jgi:hypothetical protein